MRGKAKLFRPLCIVSRITPAYAGKRRHICGPCGCRGDHPRVCGEKQRPLLIRRLSAGSPPRMRGKEPKGEYALKSERITPAYAGKRASRPTGRSGVWDHPRVCGEKVGDAGTAGDRWGSPPRMRGKEHRAKSIFRPGRITPAYAGKSGMSSPRRLLLRDHPRVCGEKTKKIP